MISVEEDKRGEVKETGRLEAFSDGIFAVAITLLVLEIKLPSARADLGLQVLRQWPSFLAYFISFMTILIMWKVWPDVFGHTDLASGPLCEKKAVARPETGCKEGSGTVYADDNFTSGT